MIRFNHARNTWEVSTPTGWCAVAAGQARQYADWGYAVAMGDGFNGTSADWS